MRAGFFAVALIACATAANAEPLSLDTIVSLAKAGLGDEAIVAKIRSSETHMDLSVDEMIDLRSKGLSSSIIAALLTKPAPSAPAALSVDSPDPMAGHPAGVYLLSNTAQKMQRIDPTVSNQAKTGGILGYALTGGIASLSVKASIQNETARVHANETLPTFYFFFDESNPSLAVANTAWAAGNAATVTSPAEFTLIRLTKKQGRREARVGTANIGGAKTGVMDKERISFGYELVRPGVFRVKPDAALAAGEYGFIYSIVGGGTGGAVTARIFDFSI